MTPGDREAVVMEPGPAAVELYWLPLGAGGHSVQVQRPRLRGPGRGARPAALDLISTTRHYASVSPREGSSSNRRLFPIGVAANVASSSRGRSAADGLGDFACFVTRSGSGLAARFPTSRRPLTARETTERRRDTGRRVLARAEEVPPLTWGRDEMRTGEMWNSNAVIAWVLSRSGIDAAQVMPPRGGRAPGWNAGLAVAQRSDSDRQHRGRAAPCEQPR